MFPFENPEIRTIDPLFKKQTWEVKLRRILLHSSMLNSLSVLYLVYVMSSIIILGLLYF